MRLQARPQAPPLPHSPPQLQCWPRPAVHPSRRALPALAPPGCCHRRCWRPCRPCACAGRWPLAAAAPGWRCLARAQPARLPPWLRSGHPQSPSHWPPRWLSLAAQRLPPAPALRVPPPAAAACARALGTRRVGTAGRGVQQAVQVWRYRKFARGASQQCMEAVEHGQAAAQTHQGRHRRSRLLRCWRRRLLNATGSRLGRHWRWYWCRRRLLLLLCGSWRRLESWRRAASSSTRGCWCCALVCGSCSCRRRRHLHSARHKLLRCHRERRAGRMEGGYWNSRRQQRLDAGGFGGRRQGHQGAARRRRCHRGEQRLQLRGGWACRGVAGHGN